MDKAPVSDAGDCEFKSRLGRYRERERWRLTRKENVACCPVLFCLCLVLVFCFVEQTEIILSERF